MRASDFDEIKTAVCTVCGKEFTGDTRWKKLAGHILSSKDHPDKRWAVYLLYNKGTIERNDFMWR